MMRRATRRSESVLRARGERAKAARFDAQSLEHD